MTGAVHKKDSIKGCGHYSFARLAIGVSHTPPTGKPAPGTPPHPPRTAEAKAQAALDRLGEGERGIEILVPMLVKCRDDPPEGAYGYFRRGCAGHELTLEIGIVRTVRKRILWPPVAFLWPK